MQIHSLRIKSYRSWRIDDTPASDIAKSRHKKLKHYSKLREEGCSEQLALQVIEISRATLFRWKAAFSKQAIAGLEPDSKTPKQTRASQWSKQIEQQVLHLRRQFPLWGKKTIHTILERDRDIHVSESTIGRILKQLIDKGKVKPVAFYYGRNKPKKARKFNRFAKRWKKHMKSENPGEMMQIDHMTVSVGPGFSIKHFEATCPFTKVTISQAYLNASSKTAALFLAYVKEKLPFKLHSIQVDGGSEFMKHFEDACQAYDIPLYVLPPRTPELNGCVERCNRTLRYEFYHCYDGLLDLVALRESLCHYMHIYNTYRPHQSLNQATPLAYYQQYFMEAA